MQKTGKIEKLSIGDIRNTTKDNCTKLIDAIGAVVDRNLGMSCSVVSVNHSYEYKIQVRREEFYHNALNFYLIKKIYRRILNMHGVSPRDLKGYYKLESYDYDNDKLESMMQELECEHQL